MKNISRRKALEHALLSIGGVSLLASCRSASSSFIRESDYARTIRMACVGDSITYGYGFKERDRESYPARLATLLGAKWEVRNFGVNGATAFRNGTRPYWTQKAYQDAFAFQPDVVILKLGTNDASERNWPHHKENFTADYTALVESFLKLASKPRVYLCRPVPIFRDQGKDTFRGKVLSDEIIPQIDQIARRTKLPIIDLHAPFAGQREMFPDGVHPNADGARLMAETIHATLVRRLHQR